MGVFSYMVRKQTIWWVPNTAHEVLNIQDLFSDISSVLQSIQDNLLCSGVDCVDLPQHEDLYLLTIDLASRNDRYDREVGIII